MAHQNNNYNNYNNYNNSFNYNNDYSNRDELFESQRKSLSELNKSENKLQSDIRFGVSVIIVVALVIIIVLGILIFGKGSSDTNNEEETPITEQVVGNDTLGYVTVPSDWKQYNTSTSYSDPTETYIITLDSTETTGNDIDQLAEQSAKNLTSDGFKEVSIKKDKLGPIDAYRIDAFSIENNKWVMNWIYIGEDNLVRIVSFETPNYDTDYVSIPQTYRLQNEQNKKNA